MRVARRCQHPIDARAGPAPALCDPCLGPAVAAKRAADRARKRAQYAMGRQGALRWYPRCLHWGEAAIGGHPWAQRCPACRAKAEARPPANGAARRVARVVVTDWAWQPPDLPAITAQPTPWRDRAIADTDEEAGWREPQRRVLR